jgi:glycerate 2-kinase
VDVVLAPVAEGGDGTVDAAVAAGYDRVTTTVAGPTAEPDHVQARPEWSVGDSP